MATQGQINDLILVADGYMLEKTNEMLVEQKKGCDDCGDVSAIMQLTILKEQLNYQMSIDDYGDQTDTLYSCLLGAVANYSGASIVVDPNANVVNTTIDVTTIGNDSPYEITIAWADFIDNGLDGRIRYENPLWAGWLPMLAIDNMPFLVEGTDFTNISTGGFELLPSGNVPAIYDGQLIRAVGYEPYGTPPEEIPEAGEIIILNGTSGDIEYNDAGAGDVTLGASDSFTKNPFVDNQYFVITFLQYTTLTVKKYDSGGTLVDTITESNTSFPDQQYTLSSMDIDFGYSAKITDT